MNVAGGRVARFTCRGCGGVALLRGGTSGYRCSPCRIDAGMPDLNDPQYLAHKAVAQAISAGDLCRPDQHPCEDCGGRASQYDHRDYSKPLEVAPVCRRCNLARGPAINPEG